MVRDRMGRPPYSRKTAAARPGEPRRLDRAHRLGWCAVSKRRKSPNAGAPKRQKLRDVFVPRPFEGLADEPEWIALRELVPAASAPLRLAPAYIAQYGDRQGLRSEERRVGEEGRSRWWPDH